MFTDEFEISFSNFLDSKEYDHAQDYIFSVARAAFLAGWKAAGGEVPPANQNNISTFPLKNV